MHYVPGHEVAEFVKKEVSDLALSTTIPWRIVRESENSCSYSCQVGDIVATKIIEHFDCKPEVLYNCLDIVVSGTGQARAVLLEEYDSCNQIFYSKVHFAPLEKFIRCCVYRYKSIDVATQQYYTVYQSVEHESVPENDEGTLFTYAPTGFVMTALPNNPNRCKAVYVSQIIDMELATSREFIDSYLATAGSLGALFQELHKLVAEYQPPIINVPLLAQVEVMRNDLYLNYYDLQFYKNWKMVEHTWCDVFTQEEGDKLHVAARSRYYSPDPCKVVAILLYNAVRKTANWHPLAHKCEVVEEVDEGSCIIRLETHPYENAIPTDSLYLLACRENIDGVCDVTWQTIQHDGFPCRPGKERLSVATNGCIITPNGHGSTMQWLARPPPVSKNGFDIALARSIGFMSLAIHSISRQPTDPPSPESVSVEVTSPPSETGANSSPASRHRKRKLATPSLMSVENIVTKITPGIQPARPFLFLVSDQNEEVQRHRFVRRRWNSAISRSTFDLLPQELLEAILYLLDPVSLLSTVPRVCSRFKELLNDNNVWRGLYREHWGEVVGRLSRRYCGDDDPTTFFDSSFSCWKDLYSEREHIEHEWRMPEHRVHGFRVASGHTRAIRSVILMPNCHHLVTGSLDKLVRVWNTHSGICVYTLGGASGVVSLMDAGPAQAKVGYKSGVVRHLELAKGECMSEIRLAESMRGCLFRPNSIITWDEDIEVWDEATQQRVMTFNGHTGYISDCAFAPNSGILFSASQDRTVKLWDTKSAINIGTIFGHTQAVNGLALIGENVCASVSGDKTMRVCDLRKPDRALHVLSMHTGKIKCIKYAAAGKKICTGGKDGIRLWHSETFQHLRWNQTEDIQSLALDEERMVYGAAGGVVQFYDFARHT